MQTTLTKRLYWVAALVGLLALAGAAVTLSSRFAFAGGSNDQPVAQACDDENEADDAAEADTETAGDDVDDVECDGENEPGDATEADDSNEVHGIPGRLDDGADLLSQAGITLDQAIATAQSAASGAVGEVDLEDYQGRLVFNVDVGDKDVKIDASNGNVLAVAADD